MKTRKMFLRQMLPVLVVIGLMATMAQAEEVFHIRQIDAASAGTTVIAKAQMAKEIAGFEKIAEAVEEILAPAKVVGYMIEKQGLEKARTQDVQELLTAGHLFEAFILQAMPIENYHYALKFRDFPAQGTVSIHPAVPVTIVALVNEPIERRTEVIQTAYCRLDNATFKSPSKVAHTHKRLYDLLTQQTYAARGGWNASIKDPMGLTVTLVFPKTPAVNTVSQVGR